MKIYFAGPIRGGRDDIEIYENILTILREYGDVLTEHIGSEELTASGEDGLSDRKIHDRDMKWVFESDIMVAEVTVPSLGVGYELGRAVENRIPVLCIYRRHEGKKLSAMINGSDRIETHAYGDLKEAKGIIDKYIKGSGL